MAVPIIPNVSIIPNDEPELLSMCSLHAGGRTFGIDTRSIREVLGQRRLERVPLAPAWIGGVVPYRGEVLTTVSFRALLGLPPSTAQCCILVLDDEEEGERFGLMVDGVGGVVTVERRLHAANPPMLAAAAQALFQGAFRMPGGLLVQIAPERLRPARLAATTLFAHMPAPPAQSLPAQTLPAKNPQVDIPQTDLQEQPECTR